MTAPPLSESAVVDAQDQLRESPPSDDECMKAKRAVARFVKDFPEMESDSEMVSLYMALRTASKCGGARITGKMLSTWSKRLQHEQVVTRTVWVQSEAKLNVPLSQLRKFLVHRAEMELPPGCDVGDDVGASVLHAHVVNMCFVGALRKSMSQVTARDCKTSRGAHKPVLS